MHLPLLITFKLPQILMLFMIVEHFKNGDPKPIRERFVRDGRMMPDNIVYHASWIDPQSARCFQVMEATDAEKLNVWMNCWDDLIDFEIIPILSSQEYWSQFE
jgi:Protein of unknown function (DUF3303)